MLIGGRAREWAPATGEAEEGLRTVVAQQQNETVMLVGPDVSLKPHPPRVRSPSHGQIRAPPAVLTQLFASPPWAEPRGWRTLMRFSGLVR